MSFWCLGTAARVRSGHRPAKIILPPP